jgi:hypothetical protein
VLSCVTPGLINSKDGIEWNLTSDRVMFMETAALAPAARDSNNLFITMSAICVIVAFGAFAPTYWLQLPAGTFVGSLLLHVHGMLFSAWTLLVLWQSVLAARGRLRQHRGWGLAGISLATAMVIIGVAVAVETLRVGLTAGYGDRARAFFVLPISAIVLFGGFFIGAIANIRRPETHKRLILLATISLLQAAMGRVFFVLMTGGGPGLRPGLGPPPPLSIGFYPSLSLEVLIAAGIIYDWRTRGRPHSAWLYGAIIMAVVIILRRPLAATSAWLTIADGLAHFAS